MSSGPDFPGWKFLETLPESVCLRQRRYISKAVCDDAIKSLVDDRSSVSQIERVEDLLQRHHGLDAQVFDIDRLLHATPPACPAALPDHPELH